jgi:hypothetical protein
MRKSSPLILLIAMFLVPLQAMAQSQWEQQVLEQIETAGEIFEPDGFSLTGQTHTGSLENEASDDFDLTLEAGVSYVLVGVCDNDCPDIDLMLLDGSGNEIDSDYETDAVPVLEVTPSRTAQYQVHVYMADCDTDPCFYGVGVFAKGAAAVGGGSRGDQSYRGRLQSGDERLDSDEFYDTYDFYGNAGDQVVIDLTSSEFDPFLILLSPSGNDTQNDDYEGSASQSRIEHSLDESGEWTVVVTTYKAGETGSYEVKISSSGFGATSAAQTGGRTERGSLASGDAELTSGEYYDTYYVSGRAGEYIVIDLRSSQFDPYLILRAPSDEQFENDDHEGDATRSQVAMELPEDGQYQVIVTSYKPGEAGSYTVSIDKGGAVSAAGPRVERGTLSAGDEELSSGEYADGYNFDGRPGQHVRLDVSSDDFDTYIMLVPPSEDQTENDDAEGLPGHSVIETDLTEAGNYLVVVTSYKVGETGSYELMMDFGEAGSTTGRQRDVAAIDVGDRTSGRLEEGDQQISTGEYFDVYVFEGSVGQGVSIELTSNDFDTYLQLQSPDGEKIDNDDYEGSASLSRIDVTLREDGRYRVLTTSYRVGETGGYELVVKSAAVADIPVVRAGPVAASGDGEGRIYGVFMGISDYPGEADDLAYTAQDAMRVHDAMTQSGMRSADAIVLTDNEATIGNLHAAVRELSGRMGPDDLFVLFYSGHGNRLPRSAGYAPTDPDALDETIELYDGPMTDDEMNRMFESVGAGTSLLVLDACFSGGFAKDVISAPGRMGLFSSEEDVTSSVAAKFRAGGYLAVFLADAVGDGLADADSDGGVSAIELSQYLHERYRADVKSAGPGEYVRTGGPQLGHQHLVVDRGSIGPYDILFDVPGSF